jgi:hypothetical protein
MTVQFSLTRTKATIAAIAMLTFAGCGSQPNMTPAEQKAGDYAEMNFDLDKCLPIEPNLYRCPAVDKPLCTVEFSRPISSACVSVRRATSSCRSSMGFSDGFGRKNG